MVGNQALRGSVAADGRILAAQHLLIPAAARFDGAQPGPKNVHRVGAAALTVEQKVREVLKIAERVCVLPAGQVSYFSSARALDDDEKLRKVYL
jgi:hypothetical protein